MVRSQNDEPYPNYPKFSVLQIVKELAIISTKNTYMLYILPLKIVLV